MPVPVRKSGRRCKPLTTSTEEKIHQLRKALGLNITKEKRNETLRLNLRAANIGRPDWFRTA
jgi:hypothetical protein